MSLNRIKNVPLVIIDHVLPDQCQKNYLWCCQNYQEVKKKEIYVDLEYFGLHLIFDSVRLRHTKSKVENAFFIRVNIFNSYR